ncbi:unnamed protein product [Orchesella dallaii]|uniref:Uncharacterized protein n=1 Tax=Orchesella dallaii TaxID=48710 RepID=A0ABP1Q1Q1_9HEXA
MEVDHVLRSILLDFLLIYKLWNSSVSCLSLLSPQNNLVLEPELKHFEACSIHVILNHINLPITGFHYEGSFNLDPFQTLPLILSLNRFDLCKNAFQIQIISENMYCDQFCTFLAPNQKISFRAPPQPKASCLVQIYVDPIPCKKWTLNGVPYAPNYVLKESYFDPIFDYRVQAREWNLAKTGLFFIHVMRNRDMEPFLEEMLYKVDNFWQFGVPFYSYSFVQPTKILFQIEFSEKEDGFQVTRSYLLSCHSYKEWWERVETACSQLKETSSFLWVYCFSIQLEMLARRPDLLQYDKGQISSWMDLESLKTHSMQCSHHHISWMSPFAKQIENIDSFYMDDLINFHRNGGTSKESMDSLILFMLSPNATFYGHEHDGIIHGAARFPFLNVVEGVFMATEWSGFVGKLARVHFITCAPIEQNGWLSLFGLAAAFQPNLWLVLSIVAATSGILLYLIVPLSQRIKRMRGVKNLAHLAFAWNVLLGQGNPAIEKSPWIGGTWALVGIVLTNAYLGDNINMLTAPLPIKRMDTFGELLTQNFSIYSPIPGSTLLKIMAKILKGFGTIGEVSYGMGKNMYAMDFEGNPYSLFALLFGKHNFQLPFEQAVEVAWKMERRPEKFETVDELISVGDPKYYEKVIGKCGMDAFVDKRESLDGVFLNLKEYLVSTRPELAWQLTMSKESYGEIVENWHFGNVPWPATQFVRRVHALLESGLVNVWKEWVYRVDTFSLKVRSEQAEYKSYEAVSLNGNVRALFFFYLAVSLAPLFVLAFEKCNALVRI